MGSAGMLPALSGILPDSFEGETDTVRIALPRTEGRRQHAGGSGQDASAPRNTRARTLTSRAPPSLQAREQACQSETAPAAAVPRPVEQRRMVAAQTQAYQRSNLLGNY